MANIQIIQGDFEKKLKLQVFKPIRIDEDDDFEVWGVVIWTIKRWK